MIYFHACPACHGDVRVSGETDEEPTCVQCNRTIKLAELLARTLKTARETQAVAGR